MSAEPIASRVIAEEVRVSGAKRRADPGVHARDGQFGTSPGRHLQMGRDSMPWSMSACA